MFVCNQQPYLYAPYICDMTFPSCLLCVRRKTSCTYPSSRKKRVSKRPKPQVQSSTSGDVQKKLDNILKMLSSQSSNAESGVVNNYTRGDGSLPVELNLLQSYLESSRPIRNRSHYPPQDDGINATDRPGPRESNSMNTAMLDNGPVTSNSVLSTSNQPLCQDDAEATVGHSSINDNDWVPVSTVADALHIPTLQSLDPDEPQGYAVHSPCSIYPLPALNGSEINRPGFKPTWMMSLWPAEDQPFMDELDSLEEILTNPDLGQEVGAFDAPCADDHCAVPSPVSLIEHTVGSSVQSIDLREPDINRPISGLLIRELITLYFENVHVLVPILHRPRFHAKNMSTIMSTSDEDMSTLIRDSLLLNSMFALASRFSSSPYFRNVLDAEKGTDFAERAKRIYYEKLRTIRNPSLEFLQGCTLLAFYSYSYNPDLEGWLIIGTCTRIASDLGLNSIDINYGDETRKISALEWSNKEEQRRLWWSIWELDTFSAAIACRPHTIDFAKIRVQLPVSDDFWFADIQVESAIINPDPVHSWHALRNCPNQDERAWFLVMNYLLLTAHDLGQRQYVTQDEVEEIENALSCYALLLPRQFHLPGGPSLLSSSPNVPRFNWIISTNIMLQGCRVFIKFLSEGVTSPKIRTVSTDLLAPLAAESQFGTSEAMYRTYADNIFNIIKVWPPEYIPFNPPFLGCLLLGPAAMHLRVAINDDREDRLEIEMLKLALSQIGQFWKFGSLLLDIANSLIAAKL
ncbi:hypothetical protein BU24DRAFT_75665 [Aaosphaeria arxii CBS 175.79]|uniref:Xylanolytic transcriptional activator regulatory domain-containing protein n=1 Tax=Aaosphaeria arxii CBS 175.79 TaxID=1450172 RepID=A0A6A5X8T3_9PLEO|nr:uncharacterized protein BU24DRAFT_75665 [Aaosphaeria arxii CBS 175.79]KAF2009475.1 hypothetical protein BU24DRAFT_75665 [Aaosphaeria arxii CBS 175.79]